MKNILSFTNFINEARDLTHFALNDLVLDFHLFDSHQHSEYSEFLEKLEKKPLWSLNKKDIWDAYITADKYFVVIVFDNTSANLPYNTLGIVAYADTNKVESAYWGNDKGLDIETAELLLNSINLENEAKIMAMRDLMEYEYERKRKR